MPIVSDHLGKVKIYLQKGLLYKKHKQLIVGLITAWKYGRFILTVVIIIIIMIIIFIIIIIIRTYWELRRAENTRLYYRPWFVGSKTSITYTCEMCHPSIREFVIIVSFL